MHKYEDFTKARDFVSLFQIILALKHINALFSNDWQWTTAFSFVNQPEFWISEALSGCIE